LVDFAKSADLPVILDSCPACFSMKDFLIKSCCCTLLKLGKQISMFLSSEQKGRFKTTTRLQRQTTDRYFARPVSW
jgi:hypothetical protein